jgi:hypothetical protein
MINFKKFYQSKKPITENEETSQEEDTRDEETGIEVIKTGKDFVLINLQRHEIEIKKEKDKIFIKSYNDPTIAGFVEFASEEDTDLAYDRLDTLQRITAFMDKHARSTDTAYNWSQIVTDEIDAQNTKAEGQARVAIARKSIELAQAGALPLPPDVDVTVDKIPKGMESDKTDKDNEEQEIEDEITEE